jgi:hypothetical protein
MSTVSVDVRRPAVSESDAVAALPAAGYALHAGPDDQRRAATRSSIEHGFLVFSKVATDRGEVGMIGSELDRHRSGMWSAEAQVRTTASRSSGGRTPGKSVPAALSRSRRRSRSRHQGDFVRDARFAPIRDLVGAGARVGDRREGRRRREPLRQRARQRASAPGLAHRRASGPVLPPHAEADAQHRAAPRSVHRRQRRPPPHPRQPHAGVLVDVLSEAVLRQPRARPERSHHRDRAGRPHRARRAPLAPRRRIDPHGPASLRRSMYVPYLTDPYEPKSEQSKMPLYHRLGAAIRKVRSLGR